MSNEFETNNIKHCKLSNFKYDKSLVSKCKICKCNNCKSYIIQFLVEEENINVCFLCYFSIIRIQNWFINIITNPYHKKGIKYIEHKYYQNINNLLD